MQLSHTDLQTLANLVLQYGKLEVSAALASLRETCSNTLTIAGLPVEERPTLADIVAEDRANDEDCLQESLDYYVKTGGQACPFCGSQNIAHDGAPDFVGHNGNASCLIDVDCHECDERWQDKYTLTEVILQS